MPDLNILSNNIFLSKFDKNILQYNENSVMIT